MIVVTTAVIMSAVGVLGSGRMWGELAGPGSTSIYFGGARNGHGEKGGIVGQNYSE